MQYGIGQKNILKYTNNKKANGIGWVSRRVTKNISCCGKL